MSTNYSEADFRRDLGLDRAPTSSNAEALHAAILSDNLTDLELAEAYRKLDEAEAHPWRLEWPQGEGLARRGQEAVLAGEYTARLGEPKAVAEAHVQRILSAAWQDTTATGARLANVRDALEGEFRHLGMDPSL